MIYSIFKVTQSLRIISAVTSRTVIVHVCLMDSKKKTPLYSCSQTINRVLFDMNNCKTWMWDETYLEESVLERTFLPVYQVPLVLVLFLILCW